MKAVFDHNYVKKIDGPNVKKGKNKMDLAEQLRAGHPRLQEDERRRAAGHDLVRLDRDIHRAERGASDRVKAFEKALHENDENIAPSMIYAYAALMEGVPFANGAPNLTVDIPAMHELARQNEAPICGKDFKTGQTLMKTILAPGFKARCSG